MRKLPPPMNLEGMNLEAIHEAIQDCHDWPERNHPDDAYHLGMRAVCTAMRLKSALEAAQQEIAARDAEIAKMQEQFREFAERSESDAMELRKEIADLKRGGVDAAELDAISDAIRCIGNDAHHASTGPAVPDALWDIRSRAYDVCALIDGIRTIPANRVLGEGQAAVDRDYLADLEEAIIDTVESLNRGFVLCENCGEQEETKSLDVMSMNLLPMKERIDALRAQPTQEPTT